ncbi:hypothetical protein BH09SUM1_BH09SUM1_30560 [soil metagenome]
MTVTALCKETGMTKQAYYKAVKARSRKEVDEELIVGLVKRERALHPTIGVRKLQRMIAPDLEEAGVSIGRDGLFKVLKTKELLGKKKRPWAPRTTNSRHRFPTFKNLLLGKELSGANEAFVADLTYIRTWEGFIYLALMMDAHSRKIVGWDAGSSLEADGCVRARRCSIIATAGRSTPAINTQKFSRRAATRSA